MAAKIRRDGTSSRSAAGEVHPALPKLRDQLQSRGRHGAPLHRETKRHGSREPVERIWETAVLAPTPERIAVISKESRNAGIFRIVLKVFSCLKPSRSSRYVAADVAA